MKINTYKWPIYVQISTQNQYNWDQEWGASKVYWANFPAEHFHTVFRSILVQKAFFILFGDVLSINQVAFEKSAYHSVCNMGPTILGRIHTLPSTSGMCFCRWDTSVHLSPGLERVGNVGHCWLS